MKKEYLARNEAKDAQHHVLVVGHGEERESRFDACVTEETQRHVSTLDADGSLVPVTSEDVDMASQRMGAALRLAAWQLGLHLFEAAVVVALHQHEALVQHLLAQVVEAPRHLSVHRSIVECKYSEAMCQITF